MTDTISSTALALLLTYAIHSTVLLSLAWVLARARRWSPAASELLWKSAMIGAILTSFAQVYLDVRPAGTLMLRPAPAATTASLTPAPHVAPIFKPSTAAIDRPAVTADAGQVSPERAPSTISMSRSSVAVIGWAIVALILGLSYVARRLILVGRLGDRHDVSDGPLFNVLAELASGAGLRRVPRLTSTSRISSPVALGIDEICVPETVITQLDIEQQRSLLAHELAHLDRRDPVWLVAGSLIERVFWIQPLNRVANREIAKSAEFLCDDWAVRRTGSSLPLARCLAQVAEWIQASPLGVPVAGMAEERSLLVSRVARLIDDYRPATRSRRGLALAAAAVLVVTVLVAPGVSGKSRNVLLADEVHSTRAVAAAHDTITDAGVVTALIARLDDENAEVRSAAAHSLGRLKDSRAVPGLIGALKDRDEKVRASAAEALAEFEDVRAIPPLTDLLNDPSTEVKRTALDALSHFEENLPAAAIARLLADPDAEIRRDAAHLAGKAHDRSATGPLAKLVGDASSEVRQAAVEAIGELGDPAAAVAIVPALSDADPDVREQALGAFEDLKAPIAEATLIGLMRDRDADVRQKAARLAGDRSMVAAIPMLRTMLDDPNADVREGAVDALGNIPANGAYDALRSALTSKDAKVRRAAAEALGDRR